MFNPIEWVKSKIEARKQKKEREEAERKYKEKMEAKLKRLKDQDPYIYD